jgi:hypothetical protein
VILRAAPVNMVTFGVYELVLYLLGAGVGDDARH